MTKDKFNLRLTRQEKALLKKIVCKNGMTITEYIRQKLFFNNQLLNSHSTLSYYKIRPESIINLELTKRFRSSRDNTSLIIQSNSNSLAIPGGPTVVDSLSTSIL